MKSLEVLVLTGAGETATAVQAVLNSCRLEGSVTVCRNALEFKTRMGKHLNGQASRVAVVDIDQNPTEHLFELSRAVTADPKTRFIVVSEKFSEQRVLKAMQAGARHFLRKSAIETELSEVLNKLLSHEGEAGKELGHVITVFSCGGGCGATTTVVNVANELRLATEKPTLIVDLDPHYGGVAAHLGVKGNYGIAHVLARNGTIDKHLIETTTVRSSEGLEVLLSPAIAHEDATKEMNYDNLLRVVDACRESHGYVIIDAPRVPRQVMLNLASISRAAVVVFQLTAGDVSRAKSIVAFLSEHGISQEKILPVANRVRGRGPLLRLADSQDIIGAGSLHRVRNSWRRAAASLNHGRTLAEYARRSGLRRDYRKIAAQLQRWMANGE
jgi:Flp pilus assembly CpaE family ATPase